MINEKNLRTYYLGSLRDGLFLLGTTPPRFPVQSINALLGNCRESRRRVRGLPVAMPATVLVLAGVEVGWRLGDTGHLPDRHPLLDCWPFGVEAAAEDAIKEAKASHDALGGVWVWGGGVGETNRSSAVDGV
jgi:hypothetical protein